MFWNKVVEPKEPEPVSGPQKVNISADDSLEQRAKVILFSQGIGMSPLVRDSMVLAVMRVLEAYRSLDRLAWEQEQAIHIRAMTQEPRKP